MRTSVASPDFIQCQPEDHAHSGEQDHTADNDRYQMSHFSAKASHLSLKIASFGKLRTACFLQSKLPQSRNSVVCSIYVIAIGQKNGRCWIGKLNHPVAEERDDACGLI